MRAAALCGADYALLMEHAPARMSENSSKCLHPPRQKICWRNEKAIPHVGRTAGFTRFHAGRAGLGAAPQAGLSREFFAGAERLVYFVLFPALLFQAILRTPISAGNAALLLQATAAMIAVGVALSWLAGPCCGPPRSGWRPPRNAATASTPTSAWRCRPASAARRQTIMALIIGFAAHGQRGRGLWPGAHSGANLLRELARNPLVVSTLAGLACNLAGLQLPGPVDTVLARLGAAAIALGILCVGASLAWEGGKGYGALIAWMLAVKLAALPLVALLVAHLLGMPPLESRMLLLFGALPTASAAYAAGHAHGRRRAHGGPAAVAGHAGLGADHSAVADADAIIAASPSCAESGTDQMARSYRTDDQAHKGRRHAR